MMIATLLAGAEQMRTVFRRGLSENLFKDSIEMGQRLETNFKGNFTDPQIGVQQQILGLLYPDPGKIVGKVDSRHLFEHLAEVEGASIDSFSNVPEPQVLSLVLLNVLLCPGDDGWFGMFMLHYNLVAQHRQVLRKYSKQLHH